MQAGVATDRSKYSLEDYLDAARALWSAMARDGFDGRFPIRLDPNGELLDGSHRLACALALDIAAVPVEHAPWMVWAPAWGRQWFLDNRMHTDDLIRLAQDWQSLYDRRHPR